MSCQMSKYFGKCFGPSIRAPKSSFWLRCPSFLLSKFASQLKLFNLWYGSEYLESASQVQFSGSCSQNSGSQTRNFQVSVTYFQVPGCQSLRVPGSRIPESWVSGSQVSGSWGPRSQVSGSQGPRSRVSGPDFRLCPMKRAVLRKKLHRSS